MRRAKYICFGYGNGIEASALLYRRRRRRSRHARRRAPWDAATALSQQIKAIERELDVQLFRRKARGVELTDAGSAFLDDARATLAQLDRAVESTRRTARGEQGRICVGVTSTSSFHPIVARAIRAFSEACPKVSLTLEESLSNELLEGLRNERMDVAFIRTVPA